MRLLTAEGNVSAAFRESGKTQGSEELITLIQLKVSAQARGGRV